VEGDVSQELIPYTETRRDQLEIELAEMANKRELDHRTNNGITVIAYWLVEQNVTTIWVHDERTNSAREFEVPPDEVMEHFHHPYANKNALITPYEQRLNND
jgi:hypothetical protein